MALSKEVVLLQLEKLVEKARIMTVDSEGVECRIFEPQSHGQPYIIEVSEKRFVRRVPVDFRVAQSLNVSKPVPGLMRDLRTAILAVKRLASRHR